MLYLFILLIFLIIIDILRGKKLLSPTLLYNIIWLFTVSLYELKLSYLQQDLSDKTIFIFIASIASFNIVSNLVSILKRKKNIVYTDDIKYDRIKFLKVILFIFFIIEIYFSKGFPLYWKLIGSSKNYLDYGISSIHGAFNGLLIVLGTYSIINKKKDSVFYIIIGILTLSRQVIMSIVVNSLVFIFFNKDLGKDKIKKYLKYVFIVLILFTILGNFRSGSSVMDNVFDSKEEYKNISVTSKWMYSYMTFSLSNFNNLVSITDGNINKGSVMLNELVPSVITNKFNININYNPRFLVSPNYTASTYFKEIYLDFGVGGIIIMNMLMALFGTNIYLNMINNKTTRNMLFYSVFAHNIIFMFFTNMFIYLPIMIEFFYISILFKNKKEGII